MAIETKVGFFVILVAVLLFILSTRLEEGEVKEGYTLTVRFKTVDGLEENAPVRIAGVKVGQVESITLDEGRAVLRLLVSKGVSIPVDSRAELRTEGLLGEKYLAIIPGSNWSQRLRDTDTVAESVSQKSLDELLGSLGELAGDIGEVTGVLADAFGSEEGKANLKAILDNTRDLTASVKDLVARNDERVDRILVQIESLTAGLDRVVARNEDQLTETVGNFRDVSGYAKEKLPKLGDNVQKLVDSLQVLIAENREGVTDAITSARNAAIEAEDAFGSLGSVARKVDEGEGTIGRLINDDTTVEGLNSAIAKIDKFLSKRERFRTYVSFEGESLMDRDDSRGIFTLTLQPSKEKYYLLEVVKPAAGDESVRRTRTVREITNTGTGAGSDFYPVDVTQTVVEEEVEEQRGNIQFSAQFARRHGDLAGRIGLKENTFGVGGDYFLAQDRVRLSLDAYDFDGDYTPGTSPHMKAKGRLDLFTYFFLTAGYDNFLNNEADSAFVGGGITFEDEDLKDLLGFLPVGQLTE
ncbi:MAG: MlaD family protein [Nitrospirota bacterium]|jgi:phospholipid/cholesterol/gamma-HCH transport system substrate-binding protein